MATTRLAWDQDTQDSAHRAPLPGWIPRPVKRSSGRTDTSRIPAHMRVIGVELDDDQRTYIRRKLGMKRGKFATSIERVSVRVTDTNGPRGGIDQVCNVTVALSGLPSVVIECRHASLNAAIDAAPRATEQAVRRHVPRRRTKPLRGRNPQPSTVAGVAEADRRETGGSPSW